MAPSAEPATLSPDMDKPMGHVTLTGDLSGDYVVTEERPDGSLVIAPDTSAPALLRRPGHRPATLEEFEAGYGPLRLPPDDEG